MVSIIIVTNKGLDDLKLSKCEKSIAIQTYKDIQLFLIMGDTIANARRRGIMKATGEYICFVDSDQVLPPDLIEVCVKKCEQGFDGVTWTERALYTNTYCEKVIDYDKRLFHEDCDDDPIKGAAEPRFFKSEFVKRLDFDKLPPITFELSAINKQINDMGAKIAFTQDTVYHHEPRTFRELFKKFFRYGYYYFPSLRYNRELVINHSYPRRAYFKAKALKYDPFLYVGLWYHWLVKAVGATMGGLWWIIREF